MKDTEVYILPSHQSGSIQPLMARPTLKHLPNSRKQVSSATWETWRRAMRHRWSKCKEPGHPDLSPIGPPTFDSQPHNLELGDDNN